MWQIPPGSQLTQSDFQNLTRRIREVLRFKHYSLRTEETYIRWIHHFLRFHQNPNPIHIGKRETEQFLTHLAVQKRVSASTQNQAFAAILFFYKDVLCQPLEWLDDVERAKKSRRVPVVFTRLEVKAILQQLEGTKWIMANILYGSGLRLMECLRLRVKDLDSGFNKSSFVTGKEIKTASPCFQKN